MTAEITTLDTPAAARSLDGGRSEVCDQVRAAMRRPYSPPPVIPTGDGVARG